MKRFDFRLERFLDIKKYRERDWEMKLSKAAGNCLKIKREMDEIKIIKMNSFQKQSGSGILLNLDDLRAQEFYRLRLDQSSDRLRMDLIQKRKEMADIKKEYLNASKEKKVLEKLREKKERQYYKEQKINDDKITDDITSGITCRKALHVGWLHTPTAITDRGNDSQAVNFNYREEKI